MLTNNLQLSLVSFLLLLIYIKNHEDYSPELNLAIVKIRGNRHDNQIFAMHGTAVLVSILCYLIFIKQKFYRFPRGL